MYKIKELKITYHGITKDATNIVHLCEICMQKNIKLYKRVPSNQIVMTICNRYNISTY